LDGTDEELMLAVASGDLDAFGELVRRHQRSAWNVAWRMLQDRAEAEDTTQDAFLKILNAAPRYRPTASFRTYLYRVISRLCLDRLPKKHPLYTDRLPPSVSEDPGPPEQVGRQETAADVRRALDALPPRQRMALVLRHFEELSYREIAEVMNTSVKSVERLLSRGRDQLAEALDSRRRE
jgi:RNA polymerase sigma-70 factor (ECF subfamily)